MRRLVVGLIATLLALLATTSVNAATNPDQLFTRSIKALESGAHDDAIGSLELLADQGVTHPDVSFNRGTAYLYRAMSNNAQPGDLGQAAAGFEEALLLRPSDDGAERALEGTRKEIARRRARAGGEPVVVNPKLGRAAVNLLSADAWAIAAAASSLLLALGLGLRRFSTIASRQLAGSIMAGMSCLMLALFAGGAGLREYYDSTSTPATVVVPNARTMDEAGAPLTLREGDTEFSSAPEGARVDIVERQGRRVRIEWGSLSAWVAGSQLRELKRPGG